MSTKRTIILLITMISLIAGCVDRKIFLSEYGSLNDEDWPAEKVLFSGYSITLPEKLDNYGIISKMREDWPQTKIQTSKFPGSDWHFPSFLIEENPSVEFLDDKIDKPRPAPGSPRCLQKLVVDATTYWQFYPSYDSMRYNYFLFKDGTYRLRISFSYELKLTKEEIRKMLASVQQLSINP